jgi:phage baseplate assembly protein W
VSANRALRFAGAVPGAIDAAPGGGLVLGATGALGTVEGDESVRQAIVLLLTTVPGERLLRPDYGAALHRLVFAPNDRTTAGLAIHYVRSALHRWEPRVRIVELDAGPDPDDPARLVIRLVYRVRASLTTDLLELTLDLGGAS